MLLVIEEIVLEVPERVDTVTLPRLRENKSTLRMIGLGYELSTVGFS